MIPSFPYSRQAETPYKTKFNTRGKHARARSLPIWCARWSLPTTPFCGQVARLALTPAFALGMLPAS